MIPADLEVESMMKKVNQQGHTYIVATFFDPATGEERTECVRDYDYSDGSRDNDALYYMPIDPEARREWLHRRGVITEGDPAKAVRGRKVPIGTTGIVVRFRDIRDRYGRPVARYAVLDSGVSVNVNNIELA